MNEGMMLESTPRHLQTECTEKYRFGWTTSSRVDYGPRDSTLWHVNL